MFHADGGIANVNRLVLNALSQRGYSLDVLALSESKDAVDRRYCGDAYLSYRVFHGNKIRFALSVWQQVVRRKYDLVIVDHVNLASILAPLAAFRRLNYTVWLHGIEVFPPRPDIQGRIGLTYAWMRIASSEFTKARVQSMFPGLVVNVCDLALDPVRHPLVPRVQATRPSGNLSLSSVDGSMHRLGQKVILHVGRLSSVARYKGQEVLLRAFPDIKKAFPESQLVLVGPGDDKSRLVSIAQDQDPQVRTDIFIPGFVDDVLLNALFQSCFVFAMPSIGEGFGLVYLEAMSYKKPCIGGKIDATPCVVIDGETGLLVNDPKSSAQIADSVIQLLAAPATAEAMGSAGYRRVSTNYLFPHFKERLLALLEG
jgi:phosphatidylinositol alpha-1,6-mannosyltransferase